MRTAVHSHSPMTKYRLRTHLPRGLPFFLRHPRPCQTPWHNQHLKESVPKTHVECYHFRAGEVLYYLLAWTGAAEHLSVLRMRFASLEYLLYQMVGGRLPEVQGMIHERYGTRDYVGGGA